LSNLSKRIRSTQLDKINLEIEKIPDSLTINRVFVLGARLAEEALEAAAEIQPLTTADDDLTEVTRFWYHLRDFLYVAAADFRGNNNSLAEALVTRRLMQRRTVPR
jgi:hypothetical protein